MLNIDISNCRIPIELEQAIQCSAQVNRTIQGNITFGEKYFENYIESYSRNHTKPLFTPKITSLSAYQVDQGFCNKLGLSTMNIIQIKDNEIHIINRHLKPIGEK